MKRITTLILGCLVASSAFSLDPPIDYTKGWTKLDFGKSFQEGMDRQEVYENSRKHQKAMKELEQLDLEDKQAIINFAKKYPKEIDNLKAVIELHKQLQ